MAESEFLSRARVGVIGAGVMGKNHAHALHDAPDVEFVGVADPDESIAREVAERYGATAYTSAAELFSDVEVVVIASPEKAHAENAVAALGAGKHVLLEKPMADTVEARRRGVRATARRVAKWSPPVFYMGVHDIDQMRWYCGCEVVEVYAASSSKGLPDGLMSILKFENGEVATLEVNWILPDQFNAMLDSALEVFGENGFVRVHGLDQGVQACIEEEGYEFPDCLHWPGIHGRITGDVQRQLNHFMRVVRNEQEPLCTARDGFESLRVARAIIDSMRTSTTVKLG